MIAQPPHIGCWTEVPAPGVPGDPSPGRGPSASTRANLAQFPTSDSHACGMLASRLRAIDMGKLLALRARGDRMVVPNTCPNGVSR
jgi:hypothetical protein